MNRFLFLSILCITFIYSSLASASNVVYVKEYVYQASEIDSKASSRAIALDLVKRQLLEELGTYLISETAVKDFKLSKDQITVLTAGVVSAEVLQEKWDGEKYYLKARISADPAEVTKSLDNLRKDREKSKELEDSNKKADEALREIERLKKEIGTLKADKKTRGKYIWATNSLSAQEWFQKGYGLSIQAYEREEVTNLRKNKDAINAFTKALKVDPQYAEAYFQRGGVYFNISNYQQTINDVTKAIEISPQYAKAYNLRGGAYLSLRRYREAIKDLDKAIEIDSQYAQAYYLRGVTYADLGNYQQAVKDYTKSIEINPQYASAYNKRGEAYANSDNYQQAIEDYNKAIEIKPKFETAYLNRGVSYTELGNEQQAIADFKIAARLGDEKSKNILKKANINW